MTEVGFGLNSGCGQMLTDLVREKAYQQCKMGEAIVMLTDAMPEMNNKQARDIIEGRSKLVTGENGNTLMMVADDWTPPDLQAKRDEVYSLTQKMIERANFGEVVHCKWFEYLDKQYEFDLIMEIDTLRKMSEYDPWTAVMQAGHVHEGYMYRMMEASKKALDEETKRSKDVTEAMKFVVPMIEDTECEFDNGWLSPGGQFYGCAYGQHIPLGLKIARTFYLENKGDEELCLEDNGWVKCGDSKWYFEGKRLSGKQIEVLIKWSRKHRKKLMINGKIVHFKELKDFCGYGDNDKFVAIKEEAKRQALDIIADIRNGGDGNIKKEKDNKSGD